MSGELPGLRHGLNERSARLLNTAPVKLAETSTDDLADNFADGAEDLAGLMQAAAWRVGYVKARNHGDAHRAAVRRANKLLTDVRKALGYSYPAAGEIRI